MRISTPFINFFTIYVIFMYMGGNKLTRRYLGDDGNWYLFCRSCGKHKPETEFYNKKDGTFGKAARCKLHYNNKDKDDDGSMNYLHLNPLTEDDFKTTREVLERLGYDFTTTETIHEQFMRKHNLKKDEKKS